MTEIQNKSLRAIYKIVAGKMVIFQNITSIQSSGDSGKQSTVLETLSGYTIGPFSRDVQICQFSV